MCNRNTMKNNVDAILGNNSEIYLIRDRCGAVGRLTSGEVEISLIRNIITPIEPNNLQ